MAEAENRRLRDAAKKERNEQIRALVAYVRRRDKRVAAERARVEAAAKEAHERNRVQATKIRQRHAFMHSLKLILLSLSMQYRRWCY